MSLKAHDKNHGLYLGQAWPYVTTFYFLLEVAEAVVLLVAGLAATLLPVLIRPAFFLIVAGPMPLTSVNASAFLKAPLALR